MNGVAQHKQYPPLPTQNMVFDSHVAKFGNSVFSTLTGNRPVIRFNNMLKMMQAPAFWAITIWYHDKTTDIRYEAETLLNTKLHYRDTDSIVSHAIRGLIDMFSPGLDENDLSGEHWTAEILTRRISIKEMEEIKAYGIDFDEEPMDLSCFDMVIREYPDGPDFWILNPEKPNYAEALKAKSSKRVVLMA